MSKKGKNRRPQYSRKSIVKNRIWGEFDDAKKPLCDVLDRFVAGLTEKDRLLPDVIKLGWSNAHIKLLMPFACEELKEKIVFKVNLQEKPEDIGRQEVPNLSGDKIFFRKITAPDFLESRLSKLTRNQFDSLYAVNFEDREEWKSFREEPNLGIFKKARNTIEMYIVCRLILNDFCVAAAKTLDNDNWPTHDRTSPVDDSTRIDAAYKKACTRFNKTTGKKFGLRLKYGD